MDSQQGTLGGAVEGNYTLAIGDVFSEAWRGISGYKGTIWLATLPWWGFMIALGIVQGLFGGEPTDPATAGLADGSNPNFIDFLASLVSYGISAVFIAGFIVLGARISLREDVQAMDVLDFLSQFLKGLLTYVLMTILVAIGFLLLILPGLYLVVAYSFALPLALEKGLSPWQALETSRKAITPRWFTMFGIVLLCQAAFLLGLFTFGIALVWFVPLIILVYGICYRNIFGVAG